MIFWTKQLGAEQNVVELQNSTGMPNQALLHSLLYCALDSTFYW